jgi:copper(I)-binding protein
MFLRIPMIIFTALTLSSAVAAEHVKPHRGALQLSHGHARATAPGQTSAAVYLTIANSGSAGDQLTKIESPAAASADLHTMSMTGGMMKMRAVDSLALAPASTVAMAPGDGYHIMLTELRKPLVAGQTIPLILTFKKAGVVKTVVTIDALTSTP